MSDVEMMFLQLPIPWRDVESKRAHDPQTVVRVTVPISTGFTRKRRITILEAEGQVHALCIANTVGQFSDFDKLVRLEHIQALAEPTSWQELLSDQPAGKQATIQSSMEKCRPFAPGAAKGLIESMRERRPEVETILRHLRALVGKVTEISSRASIAIAEQRDAVALGIEMSGVDSRKALLGWDGATEPVPFLRGLDGASSSEASVIRHDASVFGNWMAAHSNCLDVWRYEDPLTPGRSVTVLYGDKEGLERVTGTDLIYYRDDNPAFVLVQYKRMKSKPTDRTGRYSYRPDEQLDKEIERMRKLELEQSPVESLDHFRLASEPFYIKLVEPSIRRPEGNRLSAGMYFPLSLFQLLLKEKSSLGPKGGIAIGWDNARRYLSNGEFVGLVQQTWIGTGGSATEKIQELVGSILRGGNGLVVVNDHTDSSRAGGIRRR